MMVNNLSIWVLRIINRPGGDNDFNDAIFYIKATPYSSINTKALPPVRSDLPDLDNDGTPDNAGHIFG